MNELTTQSYYLKYPSKVQVQHINDIKHLETTHKLTLFSLKITHIKRLGKDCVGFVSTVKSPLLRLLRKKEAHSFIYKISPFMYRVYIDGEFHIFFLVLPMTDETHLLTVSVYTKKKLPCRWLIKPFIDFAIKFTIFEDLQYYEQANK